MLKKMSKIEFKIKLLTGLHIGCSNDEFDIGGADSNVIKNPLTHEPYIPGSSLKGKLRSLLTLKYGKLIPNKDTIVIFDDAIRNIFEPVESEDGAEIKSSRAIFRDASLSTKSSEELQKFLGIDTFTEIKAENKIKIMNGTAENPRFIERVPAGAEFEGEIVLQIYDHDDEQKMKNAIQEAFRLLEMNYLGGNGTRGYGRVQIETEGFKDLEL